MSLMTMKAALCVIISLCLLSGNSNSTATISRTRVNESESCGHVTNVIVHGGTAGEQGPQGERGAPGPRGERGERGPPGQNGQNLGGVVFMRWGRRTCPATDGTQLLYEGIATGSYWGEGSSADYLCLHKQPQFLRTTGGRQTARGRIYGTEYEAVDSPPAFGSRYGHDAPCAVCYVPTRGSKIVIPARTSCPPSWTREYYGYLMADKAHGHHKSRVSVCVDRDAESVAGSSRRNLNSLFYFIEATCTGIRCPPYFDGAEITCTVCTK